MFKFIYLEIRVELRKRIQSRLVVQCLKESFDFGSQNLLAQSNI